jgi:hypothetical protein
MPEILVGSVPGGKSGFGEYGPRQPSVAQNQTA